MKLKNKVQKSHVTTQPGRLSNQLRYLRDLTLFSSIVKLESAEAVRRVSVTRSGSRYPVLLVLKPEVASSLFCSQMPWFPSSLPLPTQSDFTLVGLWTNASQGAVFLHLWKAGKGLKAIQCLSPPSSFYRKLQTTPLSILTLPGLTRTPTLCSVVRSKNNVSYHSPKYSPEFYALKLTEICFFPNRGPTAQAGGISRTPSSCYFGGNVPHRQTMRSTFQGYLSLHYTRWFEFLFKRLFLTGGSCRIGSFLYGIVPYCP